MRNISIYFVRDFLKHIMAGELRAGFAIRYFGSLCGRRLDMSAQFFDDGVFERLDISIAD